MAKVIEEHVKDPGSAITHFIGMLMAIFAAIPLLIKAAHEPGRIYLVSIAVYAVSLILLYAASTTYHTFNISKKVNTILKKIDHMMISVLIAGSYTPICLLVLGGRMGWILLAIVWNSDKGVLGILPEVGIFRTLYRNGVDLCTCIYTAAQLPVTGGIWMAFSRRNHLYSRRSDLCTETSDF